MASKTTISISEARSKIYQIADDVAKYSQHITLTENGRAKVVILSADEFDSWQETFAVMEEFPDLDKDIEGFKKDLKTGAYKKYKTIEEIILNQTRDAKKPKSKKI